MFLRLQVLAVSFLVLSAGLAGAQSADPYAGLNQGDRTRPASTQPASLTPGVDYPLLELDSDFRLLGAKTTLWLTDKGQRRQLGILDQGAIRSLGGIYSFRATRGAPVLATLDWKDITLDPAGKIVFRRGDERGEELGRIRQRTVLTVGTGLDVYRKGEQPVGYVDEKAGKHLENLFIPAVFTQKYYSFESLSYRQEKRNKKTGFGRWASEKEVVETKTDRAEICRFLGGKLKASGPSGIFTTVEGKPILAVKGDWWLSKHIFDLVVKRIEAEGTAGAVATGIGLLLVGETDEQRRERKRRENEPVRNPSAYLGAFLAGLIYFPEFRAAVGLELPSVQ